MRSIVFGHYAFKPGSFYAAPCVRNGLGNLPLRMRQLFDIAECCITQSGAMTQLCNKVVAMDGICRKVKDVFNVGITSVLQD